MDKMFQSKKNPTICCLYIQGCKYSESNKTKKTDHAKSNHKRERMAIVNKSKINSKKYHYRQRYMLYND